MQSFWNNAIRCDEMRYGTKFSYNNLTCFWNAEQQKYSSNRNTAVTEIQQQQKYSSNRNTAATEIQQQQKYSSNRNTAATEIQQQQKYSSNSSSNFIMIKIESLTHYSNTWKESPMNVFMLYKTIAVARENTS